MKSSSQDVQMVHRWLCAVSRRMCRTSLLVWWAWAKECLARAWTRSLWGRCAGLTIGLQIVNSWSRVWRVLSRLSWNFANKHVQVPQLGSKGSLYNIIYLYIIDMCVCTYIYIYVCVCMYIYIYMCVCIYHYIFCTECFMQFDTVCWTDRRTNENDVGMMRWVEWRGMYSQTNMMWTQYCRPSQIITDVHSPCAFLFVPILPDGTSEGRQGRPK